MLLVVLAIVAALLYAALMFAYRKGWQAKDATKVVKDFVPTTTISIIIPARNEEECIGRCLNSILAQDYPKELVEVVVIDDHSTDDTANVVSSFAHRNVRCLSLSDHLKTDDLIAYKKAALTIGVNNTIGDLLITTDADCIATPNWLRSIAHIYEKEKPVMIISPVDYISDDSVLQVFQSLDFMSMQGITVASHELHMGNMCNGANLSFTRAAFIAVNGYENIDHLASGDDYLLMMKMSKHFPSKIACLKSIQAIVKTEPQYSWSGFIQQRIRWASKSGKYDDKRMTSILVFVYLFNVLFLALLVASFFSHQYLWVLLALLLLKIEVDLIYLYPVARFFKKEKQLWLFPLLQPLHIFYIIVAGLLGFVGVYKWKGRTVK
ncbi:MAG: glycosyltransferase [Flavipsychrobacter sp.]